MDILSMMDSSDDELFDFPSRSLFGRVDIALGRPSLRRQNRRSNLILPATDAADILNEIMSILTGEATDDSFEVDNDDSSVGDDSFAVYHPPSLVELSARVVAKNTSCAVLEQQKKPPLDENLIRKVAYWAFPQDVYRVRAYAYLTDRLVSWRRGVNLVKEDKIKEMWQVGFMATAYLAKYGQQSDSRSSSEIRVSLVFEQQKIISSTCSECKNEVWCEHVIAAVLYRIRNPDQVHVYAPMTEILSTLDRNQLQKLVQYAVQDDPAGVLGKVFKHLDDLRDSTSEMSVTAGAPDPTFGGLQGEKSQWQLSLEQLEKRLDVDLDAMIRARSFFDYSEGRSQEYYPDSYDISIKMQSKFFFYITPVLELARQQEYMAAAEVMKRVVTIIVSKMDATHNTACVSLSRLWHDLSHVYTLLLLKIDDNAASSMLIATAEKLNRTKGIQEYLLEQSQWAELPSLCSLFPNEVNKIKEKGQALVEPLISRYFIPCPKEFKLWLNGVENFDKCCYDEDLVTMLARLETVFYFEFERSFQKIARIAFIILHKLAILAQSDSVIGGHLSMSTSQLHQAMPSAAVAATSKCDPIDTSPSVSSDIPRPASSRRKTRNQLSAKSSKNATPGDLDSTTDSSPAHLLQGAASSVSPAVCKRERDDTSPLAADGRIIVGKGKSARMSTKDKHPAKRLKKSSPSELVTDAKLTKGQVAHAMLYTLRLLIATQKASNIDIEGRKLLVGFCLQALEISRHRTTASSDNITHLEQDWLLKLETCICDYLQTMSAADASDAVTMYIDALGAVGMKFYGGGYPLVLLEMLCHLCMKNETLKATKGRELVHICADVLLNMTMCLEKVTLPMMKSADFFWEVVMDGCLTNQRKHREFAIRKFHVITETFLSLVGTDAAQDIDLLVKILSHFENLKLSPSSTIFPLLKMINKDLRLHVWRFKEEQRVIEAMLRFSIHAYHESQTLFVGSSSTSPSDGKRTESVEREFIFSLARKLGVSGLSIFSECWQRIFTCKDLQELILLMDLKVGEPEGSSPPPEVTSIIMEFYGAKRFHDDDACTLMTRFFKPGDENYNTAVGLIVANAEFYHAGALFQLAQVQQASQQQRRKDGMDADTFGLVIKALEKVSAVSPKILEYIDWMFNACTSHRRDPTKSVFYSKMVNAICKHAGSHPEIILRILQHMEHVHASMIHHPTAAKLGSALVKAYREHFAGRFRECGHAAYTTVISEMQRARLECKHYVKNGDSVFDAEVVEIIREMHSTKKKLMKLLNVDFPEPSKPSTS